MHTILTTHASTRTKRLAQRGLTIFFVIVVALSIPVEALIISVGLDGDSLQPLLLIAALMAIPAIASVVARLALHEGFADVSFRVGGSRGRAAIQHALAFPLVVGLIAYGIGWATGLAGFAAPPTAQWLVGLIASMIISFILALGEELGWRGYMLTRLIDAGVTRPVFASGLIWGLWHAPLVLWAGYASGPSPLFSAFMLLVTATAIGYVFARMRLETGSVWPAVALHAAWNTIIQQGFDPATTGANAALWVGESGLLTALTLIIAAAIYSHRPSLAAAPAAQIKQVNS